MGVVVNATPTAAALEAQRRGYFGLSLSAFDTSAEPQLLGTVEDNGALYEFSTLESATGWAAIATDALAYIKLVPNVGAGTIAAVYTETVPAWDSDKYGWYGTSASINHRYIGGCTKTSATEYDGKFSLATSQANARFQREVTVAGKITLIGGILSATSRILTGTDLTGDDVFDFLSPVMAVGDYMRVNASVSVESDTDEVFGGAMVLAHRQSSTIIGFYGTYAGMNSGSGLSYSDLFEDGALPTDGAAVSGNGTAWPRGDATIEKCVIVITY